MRDIYESLIDRFIQKRRSEVAPASVNGCLVTPKRALRLAYRWKLIQRVPQISLLSGERVRDFVLSHEQESLYLATAPQPLADVALLILDTGLRVGEAIALEWTELT